MSQDNLKFLIIGIAVAFVLGAGTMFLFFGAQKGSGPGETERLAAQHKLNAMLSAKQRREAEEAERRRLEEERRAAALAEAAKPRYAPARLRQAEKVKQWANVTVPTYNFDAWLRTLWKDGRVIFRLALLGDSEALEVFTNTWPTLRITFADQGGRNVHEILVPSSQMRWASRAKNEGIPTMELDSSSDMPLELYEEAVQWNFKWESP